MNMIEKNAQRIARAIRKHDPHAADEEVLTYSLIIVLNTSSIIAIVLLAAGLTGRWLEGGLALISFALLRFFSGGVHLSSSVTCTVASSLLLIGLMFIPFGYLYTGLILDLISLTILLVRAPDNLEKTIHINLKYKWLFKLLSLIIVSLNLWLQNPILSAAFFTQSLLTTPLAYTLASILERKEDVA